MKVFDFKRFMARQCEEICKHRWLESEKVGYDLGKMIEIAWVNKYAAKFRAWAMICDEFYSEDIENG